MRIDLVLVYCIQVDRLYSDLVASNALLYECAFNNGHIVDLNWD